jgi:uncharacterized repeat protein (TIGR01451 family)
LAVTLAGLLAFTAARAEAVPGTQEWTGEASGPTPDIELSGLTFNAAGGGTIPSSGLAGTLNFTLDGVPRVGYCTDTSRTFSPVPEAVDVTIEDPPATPERRAMTWILLNRTPTGAPTPDTQFEAAAAQVAVWLLVDAQIDTTTPTSSPAVNAAAQALVAEALAATATPASLGMSIAPPAAGATTATVTLSGKPGATVSLAITGGTGSLSATSVVIGAGGTASVTLTSPAPGSVTVQATTAGDGRLFNINPTDPVTNPQPTGTAEPTQIVAATQVTFGPAPSVTPTRPAAVIAQARPRLAITKTAPRTARVLQRVRYRITVRNPGRVTARNVILRDRLPRGLAVVRTSRKGTMRNGTVTFRLGTLRPGQSRTVTVWLVANASVRGTRVNVATVSATQVRPLRARAATAFRPLARRVQPAVTG